MPHEQTCGKGRLLRERQGDDELKPRLHRFVPFNEHQCAPQHMLQISYATRSCCRRFFPDISAQSSLNTPRPTPPCTYIWPNASEISYHFSKADFKFAFSHCFRGDCTRNAPPTIQRCEGGANGQCFGGEEPAQAVQTAAFSSCSSTHSLFIYMYIYIYIYIYLYMYIYIM